MRAPASRWVSRSAWAARCRSPQSRRPCVGRPVAGPGTDLAAVADLTVPGIDALGISDRWLVTREHAPGGRDSLVVRPLAALDQARVVAATKPPAELGRPAIDGDLLVIHVATRALSRIR